MAIDESVELESHNPEWHDLYETEGVYLLEALGDSVRDIEHVGSTAVQGLLARPVVDIMVGVDALEVVSEYVVPLQQIGYEYLGEAGVSERFFFRKRNGDRFDVSIVLHQGEHWRRNLLVRDYLREHPEVADRYGELKRTIVEDEGIDEPTSYSERKRDFIEDVLERARAADATR